MDDGELGSALMYGEESGEDIRVSMLMRSVRETRAGIVDGGGIVEDEECNERVDKDGEIGISASISGVGYGMSPLVSKLLGSRRLSSENT